MEVLLRARPGEKHGRHTGIRQVSFFGEQAWRGKAACKAFASVTNLEMGSACRFCGSTGSGQSGKPPGKCLLSWHVKGVLGVGVVFLEEGSACGEEFLERRAK